MKTSNHLLRRLTAALLAAVLALSIALLNRFRKMLHRKNWEYILSLIHI